MPRALLAKIYSCQGVLWAEEWRHHHGIDRHGHTFQRLYGRSEWRFLAFNEPENKLHRAPRPVPDYGEDVCVQIAVSISLVQR